MSRQGSQPDVLARAGLSVQIVESSPSVGGVNSTNAKYIDGLEKLEFDRRVMTPEDVEARFRAPDGYVYHVDPIATRFGPMRPLRGAVGYRTPVEGLFLIGASTHPSAGIYGIPGQQAARAVLRGQKSPMSLRRRLSR